MQTVYLNGHFVSADEAKISVYDRGFIFGDGIYEVIAIIDGTLLFYDDHIERLDSSLSNMDIAFPTDTLLPIVKRLMNENGANTGSHIIYMHISRGEQFPRKHVWDNSLTPTIFMDIQPCSFPDYKQFSPQRVITQNDSRWGQCHIKSTNLIANTQAATSANHAGAVESILFKDNKLIEGSKSNVFIVKNNVVMTPPPSNFMLSGITRKVVLDLLRKMKIAHLETTITKQEFLESDEVWITSTTRHINPITQVDDVVILRNRYGPMWTRVFDAFEKTYINHKQHA